MSVRAHGLRGDEVVPDWPPLTEPELITVLAEHGLTLGAIIRHSPRPFSAAAQVRTGPGSAGLIFVKRHHVAVRTIAQLAEEHAFQEHLSAQGAPVPRVLGTASRGEFTYELMTPAPGLDLYADAHSWTRYRSRQHAHHAGAALARLHIAAQGFDAPERAPAPLLTSLPGEARAITAGLPPLWTHNDWHGSNLTWSEDSPGATVAGVFDLGLANRTCAMFDLAIAIERSCVDWLAVHEQRAAATHPDQARALLDGYASVVDLTPHDRDAVAALLPFCHITHAQSEIAYFTDVTHDAGSVRLARDAYLAGHARWWASSAGRDLLAAIRSRAVSDLPAASAPRGPRRSRARAC